METTRLKLLTIVADEALLHVLEETLLNAGATGYTLTAAAGLGKSGLRNSPWEGENIKIEVIVQEEVLEKILQYISTHLFDKYPIITYYNDVHVLRTKHFIR